MSTDLREAPDPEDMFADTRMSFGEHIEDLRTHLIRAIVGFVVGMALCIWPLGYYVLRIIVTPVEDQLEAFEQRKLKKEMEEAKGKGIRPAPIKLEFYVDKEEWNRRLGHKAPESGVLDKTMIGFERLLEDLHAIELLDEENRLHGNFVKQSVLIADPRPMHDQLMIATQKVRRPRLSSMGITEAFMVYFKVAMLSGLVISSPWVFYQIWMFIAAGLYPHEKRIVHVYLPFSIFLFLSGVMVCQFLVMPRAVEAMLFFNEWLGIAADLRLNEWLTFALLMPLVFGISFQTPMVMMFLNKVGLLRVQNFRDYRKIAWFVMAVLAAVFTPFVDAISMLFMWVPMCALYELGILLCIYQGEPEPLFGDDETEEQNRELVEV